MTSIRMVVENGIRHWLNDWNLFWFQPQLPYTLAVLRILTGLMIAYIHAIWLSDLSSFMGESAWIDSDVVRQIHVGRSKWSYLWYVHSMPLLIVHQWVAILAAMAMAIGLFSRVSVPLAWFLTLMVCHRMTGLLFGLDQVVMMLAMYLMIAPSGAAYSIDAWLRSRSAKEARVGPIPSTMTNIATRLIQIHLCVVYLFGGVSKLRGDMWWDGTALWFAAVSYEYQSLDLTWLGRFPFLAALLTHLTVFWETFYCALVWPKATRPWMLVMAVFVHAGIGLFLGMITFGWMMIVANGAFIPPETTQRLCQAGSRWLNPKRQF